MINDHIIAINEIMGEFWYSEFYRLKDNLIGLEIKHPSRKMYCYTINLSKKRLMTDPEASIKMNEVKIYLENNMDKIVEDFRADKIKTTLYLERENMDNGELVEWAQLLGWSELAIENLRYLNFEVAIEVEIDNSGTVEIIGGPEL